MELAVIAAAITGIVAFVTRLSEDPRKVKRTLARVTPQRSDRLADGIAAAVQGTVCGIEAATALLESPISKRPCVFWLVVFEEVGAKDFAELGRAHKGVSFLLRDDHGTTRVVPDHPRIALPSHDTSYSSAMDFFTRSNHPLLSLGRQACRMPNHYTTSLRMREYVIAVGDVVKIHGWVTREVDPTAAGNVTGYRAELPTRAVISGSRKARLLIGR